MTCVSTCSASVYFFALYKSIPRSRSGPWYAITAGAKNRIAMVVFNSRFIVLLKILFGGLQQTALLLNCQYTIVQCGLQKRTDKTRRVCCQDALRTRRELVYTRSVAVTTRSPIALKASDQ